MKNWVAVCLVMASVVYGDDQQVVEKAPPKLEAQPSDFYVYDPAMNIRPYVGIVGGIAPLAGTYKAKEISVASGMKDFASLGGTPGLIGGVYGIQMKYWRRGFFAVQVNTLSNTLHRVVSSSKNSSGIVNAKASIKNYFQWGADLRFGGKTGSTNHYIFTGFESGKWGLELRNDSSDYNQGISPNSSITTHQTLWGGKFGAGITFPLHKREIVWVNMEYSYTWFGHVNNTLTNPNNGNTWTHRANVQQNSVLFGMNYLF